MATSGTTAFTLNINELFEEAFERATGGTRQLRSGYDFKTTRRSLNLLTIEWASRGVNLWTLESGTLPLLANVGRYVLPADTVDLVEHLVRQGTSSSQTDLTLTRISVSNWASIPNKISTGRPINIFIERTVDGPVANIWKVPSDGSYTLYYWRMRRIQDAGTGTVTQDIPYRFLPVLVAGLAYYLSGKLPEGLANQDRLQGEYERQWDMASSEDREKASVRFVPMIGRL